MVDEVKAPEAPAKPDAPIVIPPEPKLWQVRFKSGQGQQVRGANADVVRALMVKTYGADYEILSITEVPK
jgi:hypothetical protein